MKTEKKKFNCNCVKRWRRCGCCPLMRATAQNKHHRLGGVQQIATISVGGLRQPIKRKATPQEISHMNAWLDALAGLPEGQRRIVVARACSIPWRRLEEIDGRSHTTLRKIEGHGLEMLLKTTIGGTPIKGLEN